MKTAGDYIKDNLGRLWWDKVCYYCGIGLSTNGNRAAQISVDRKDNSIGYTIENIELCCQRCNTIKGNIFTAEEMSEIAHKYIKPKLQKGDL